MPVPKKAEIASKGGLEGAVEKAAVWGTPTASCASSKRGAP